MKSRNKDHKPHESIIGKIIYGFLLFMPLLAIGVTCAYAIFNKNAYLSNSNSNITEKTSEVGRTSTLEDNILYTLDIDLSKGPTPSTVQYFNYKEISIDWTDYNAPSTYTYDGFGIYKANSTQYYVYLRENNVNVFTFWGGSTTFGNNWSIAFTNKGTTQLNGTQPANIYFISYQKQTLDNVFYYSIDKVQESPLFNWAENSLIYTGMTNTCNALDITTPFIPLLMTYWLIISVIYILYDIILVILHIFHKKIHQLEDSF